MKKNILLLLILMTGTFQFLYAQDIDTDNNIDSDTTAVCPINIEEIQNNSILNVFPNPSEGTFQVIYGSITACPPAGWGGILIINITNEYNKTVYTETIIDFDGEYNKTIDLSTLEKGVYTVVIAGSKIKKVKREILQ